ncbi:Cthe_2314 family HEPN domain-containing protein [Robertmurraya sp. GLU-23]
MNETGRSMGRTINITPFEGITEVDLNECIKESPLKHFKLPKGMFQKGEDYFWGLDNWDTKHWELILNNRLLSVNRNFGYAMFYYYKGIPDEEWVMSPGKEGQSVQLFPHFYEQHHSNHYNFTYFVDVFFLQSFTLYETIGHLLFKLFNLENNENNPRNQISFNNAIYKLNQVSRPLYKDLNKVKQSNDFKIGVRMRNDIAHNHPPYRIDSGVTKSEGVVSIGVGNYTTSNEIKTVMIGLLKSIKATFEVLEKHLQVNN